MSTGPVAVIDIGSNSIKLLVASRDAEGRIATLASRTLDARISAGISQEAPELTEESMQRGIGAIRELLAVAAPLSSRQTILVATSAVRDAVNGQVFRERVRQATGQAIRLLSGEEEANLIGRGLTCDPALADLRDFYVFDLGGGSLECLAFRDRRIEQAVSLQLGCVRLTEQFVRDPVVWIASPLDGGHACMTSGVPIAALIGRLPLRAFPTTRMSGVTPSSSHANQRPVRPQPV
jgi:exopolyphosphatase/guanosine-5'-triphosphate,3'-diphosphate pyrophosphatase